VLAFVAQILSIMRSRRLRITTRFPPGSRLGIALKDHSFRVSDAIGRSEVGYDGYAWARRVGDTVVHRRERPGVSNYLPRELVTAESLA
jgi:hypothetical protein